MRYTVYLDVFFGMNFCLDVWILVVTGGVLGERLRWGRILLAGGLGAVGACLGMVGGISEGWSLWWLSGILALGMVGLAFGGQEKRRFLRCLAGVYGVSFLLGGGLYAGPFGGEGMPFWMSFAWAGALGISLLEGAWWFRRRTCHRFCRVQLRWKGLSLELTGLVDTGNTLTTSEGRAVHVVSAEALRPWMEQPLEGVMWVAYRSVGTSGGVLPAICIDELRLEDGTVVLHPVIALSKYPVSRNAGYQILLHPQEVFV